MMPIAILKMTPGVQVQLQGSTPQDSEAFGTPAVATATFNNIGTYVDVNGSYNWLLSGTASNFEMFAVLNNGSATGSAFNTWLNLGTTRSWSLTRSPVGSSSSQVTVQIRKVGTTTVLATGSLNFTAVVT